jgi:hypothetical protein
MFNTDQALDFISTTRVNTTQNSAANRLLK